MLTRLLWDSADTDKFLKSPFITIMGRYIISLISGVFCLTSLLSPHFTLYKAARPWAEHGSEQLGASTVVTCESLWAQVKGLRGQVWKKKDTWARVKYTGCKGITEKLWDQICVLEHGGKGEKELWFLLWQILKANDKIHSQDYFRSPKTATTPVCSYTLCILCLK